MSEESDSLRTSPSVASLSENELPLPPPEPPGYVCSLTEDLVTKAREELQEKPEWRLRDVQALRDMVRKEYPYLSTSLDDAFLLRFLRARKFDYDRALQLLVNYHGCRRNWPEVFSNLRPSALKDVLNSGFLTVLPHTDPRGCHVLCIRPDRWIPSNYPITENIRAIYLTLEKLIQSEETQVNGIVILADYKGVSLSKASHFGPFIAKKVIGILQDGFPIRIKAVHIVNEPRIFKGIFAIIKPFLKEKIANRMVVPSFNTACSSCFPVSAGNSSDSTLLLPSILSVLKILLSYQPISFLLIMRATHFYSVQRIIQQHACVQYTRRPEESIESPWNWSYMWL
ncbi:alpha-tocopherol transfer protein-like isoform X2 [Chionomys nivalis]|uniref:alpha-tocopherol transfer protein-like isoform X2 n=1 Tax=Chionomys nivalis TaxID=269649 RepID=UPI0025994190|nr:alpha-tocopherol transfer protein-like isoform X2 [Chionomys nivalis]